MRTVLKIIIMVLFVNVAANDQFNLEISKPANSMQFSFKRKNGEVLLLQEHMPKNERGNYFNIIDNMRKAIVIHHPEALDEFDEALRQRQERIDKLDALIEQTKQKQ